MVSFFIHRPIFASSIAVIMVLAGAICYFLLPVSQFPDITPPQVVVSYSPAILVPVNGAPVWKPVPDDSRFQRVINTSALILKGGLGDRLYMHVYDGWLSADSIAGPWTLSNAQPLGMDDVASKLAKSGQVDLLDGGPKANPKPTLAGGRVPTIVVSTQPTELIVFKGQPDFVPITGTSVPRKPTVREIRPP